MLVTKAQGDAETDAILSGRESLRQSLVSGSKWSARLDTLYVLQDKNATTIDRRGPGAYEAAIHELTYLM